MVVVVNTILFLLATKLRQRESAAKIFISNLRFGDPSIWVAECEIHRHVHQGSPSQCDGKFGGYCPVLTGCCMSAMGKKNFITQLVSSLNTDSVFCRQTSRAVVV